MVKALIPYDETNKEREKEREREQNILQFYSKNNQNKQNKRKGLDNKFYNTNNSICDEIGVLEICDSLNLSQK